VSIDTANGDKDYMFDSHFKVC